jgi:hypothetical protein
MEFVDIAGLVAGASRGEGLGNKFLAHIRETHTIAQVVRCFADDNIVHVSGKVDPVSDMEIINTELCLADQETLERARDKAAKLGKSGDKSTLKKLNLIDRMIAHIDTGKPARTLNLDHSEADLIRDIQLLTGKPTLYIANVSEDGLTENPLLTAVEQVAAAEGAVVIPVCAAMEAEIAQLDEADKQDFLTAMGLEEPGLHRLINAGYRLLGLQTFFTAGPKEVRAWTIKSGVTAPRAAGTIHTDFEHGFIRAEVIAFADYLDYKGEQGAKEAGKWRLEGKDYIVKDGDVMLFRFNV